MRGWAFALIAVLVGCETGEEPLDVIAESYVGLALALDEHDPGYVDARLDDIAFESLDLADIESRARRLREDVVGASPRHEFLRGQLGAVASRATMLRGVEMSFDEEARALYGASPPERLTPRDAKPIHEDLEELLSGEGPLLERYLYYEQRGRVPRDRLEALARAALGACRERSTGAVELPAGEHVDIELVRGKAWASYHRYLGDFESVVEINRDLEWTVAALLEAVCHESYPGHHMTTVLIDDRLVRRGGLVEHTIQVLRSPQAARLERVVDAAVDLALSQDERREFERELAAAAGLDSGVAATDDAIDACLARLRPFAVEGARRYLDGELDRPGAVLWLERNALVPDGWTFLEFVDRYGSYVMTYVNEDTMDRWIDYEQKVVGVYERDAT